MKNLIKQSKTAFIVAAPFAAALAITGCDIDKTEDGRMPSVDVDVSADSGKLPKYEIETAEIKVGTTEETILVPEVRMVEKKVDVPTVGVDMPDDDNQ